MKSDISNFYYYSPQLLNFGDTMNKWLWEQVLNDNQLTPGNEMVLGMGSIFVDRFFNENRLSDKDILVLGSGAKSADSIPSCQLMPGSFFRGPLTAKLVTGQTESYISDSAYFLRQTRFFETELRSTTKKYEVSLMPYFRSMDIVDWKEVGTKYKINIIDPRVPKGIEYTLKEIAESKYLIAEAMHGAILADVLRVPWKRLEFLSGCFETASVAQFKWQDWLKSIEVAGAESIKTGVKCWLSDKVPFHWRSTLLKLRKRQFQTKLEKVLDGLIQEGSSYHLSDGKQLDSIDDALQKVIKEVLR